MPKSKETRTPLDSKPLHNPGESLEKFRNDILVDKVLPWILLPLLFLLNTINEWRLYKTTPKSPPIFGTILTSITILLAIVMLSRYSKQLGSIRKGIEGEKYVGQYLENLRSHGYVIFHDIIGESFNVDHVVISDKGIFVIETKTWYKPMRGNTTITLDGDGKLVVNGFRPDRDPVQQVTFLAEWLHGVLKDSSGFDFPVRPVLIFPGWYISPEVNKVSKNLWVLNNKSLEGFIENQTMKIEPDKVKMAAEHLKAYIIRTSTD